MEHLEKLKSTAEVGLRPQWEQHENSGSLSIKMAVKMLQSPFQWWKL